MRIALLLVLVAVLALPGAAAHAGAMGPGDTLSTATPIAAPGYVFAEAAGGVDVHYYRIEGGRDIRIRLATLPGREPADVPVVFVFGPTFPEAAIAPADVERPNATGGAAFPASGRATWDAPALGLRTTELLDRAIALGPGEHFLVVRSQSAAPLLLVLESPTARWLDPLVVPGLRDEARAWSGASAWIPIGAGLAAAGIVVAIAWRQRARPWSLHALAAFASAALVAGTGAALATDAARVGVGWIHAGGALLAAAYAILSTRPALPRPRWWQRALLFLAGALAFFLYAGALWGPVAAIAGALLPEPGERITPAKA